MSWPPRNRKDQRKWLMTFGTLLQQELVHYKHLFFNTKRYTEFLGCTMLAPVAPARSHRRSCIGDVHTTHSTTVPTVTPTMLSSSAKSFCTPKRLHHVKLKGLPKINTTSAECRCCENPQVQRFHQELRPCSSGRNSTITGELAHFFYPPTTRRRFWEDGETKH